MTPPNEAPARTVRACTFAGLTLVLLLALRARSDGETPSLLMLFASFGLVAIVVRPFTTRERSWAVVFFGLVVTQLVLHVAFLFASTGQLAHDGNAGLFCSPASAPAVSSCAPTERGGLLLLAVQLLAAAIFATWARGAESVTWQLARRELASLVSSVVGVVSALFMAMLLALPQVAHCVALQAKYPGLPRLPLLARERGRRGPPQRQFDASVLAAQATPALSF